ncbi:Capsule polysaccharide export protein [Rubrivivax sp. A210]|nr:Capsule polysaccharide export protein [Rubrivivax sp. A210]
MNGAFAEGPTRVAPGAFRLESPRRRANQERPAPEAEPQADQGESPAPTRAEPEPNDTKLTEFQRFVLEASGQRPSLHGYDLFSARRYPPLTNVPVPVDYVIGPGDELLVQIWGAVDGELRPVVDRNGQIFLPRVGTFRVAGTRAADLESVLRQRVARVYKNFELSATLGALRSMQIFVVGQARRPGSYTVSSLSTLLSALFEVGGPAITGSLRGIQLRRNGTLVSTLDLYRFIADGDKTGDARLLPGDVIVIPPAGPRIALLGSTDQPGIYELASAQEPLSRVLAYAGNLRAMTSLHKVQLERVDSAERLRPRTIEERALDAAGLETPLRDGDIVTLFKIKPQFANAVTLRGNVAAPLRHAYRPEMRISDLIPEREALIQQDYFIRKNMLVQFESGTNISLDRAAGDVKNLLSEINWDYAVVERLDAAALRTVLLPFNLGRAVLARDPEHNLELKPGDVVTVFGVKDIPVPREKATRLVRVSGEVNVAGVYQIGPNETLRSALQRAGGLTPQAYLFGTVFTRESTRAMQRQSLNDAVLRLESTLARAANRSAANMATTNDNGSAQRLLAAQEQNRQTQLARLRNLEPSGRIALELVPSIDSIDKMPDLPLEDGDRIHVPVASGFVYTVGAVLNSNALLWRPGRTVNQYLLAAGLEPVADADNAFVFRADGSIVHHRDESWLSRSFESMELAQGDTIIVPEKLDLETPWSAFVRGLKDWTLVLSNFGLTAAAIHTLGR